MQLSRSLPVAVVAAAAAVATSARDAHGQIPPSVEFRVPKAPTVAVTDSGTILGYELFVTNLTASPMTLRRVEVLSAGKVVATLADADTSLPRATSRVTQIPVADRLKLDGGARATIYLWIPVDRSNPPAQLRHRLTFQRDTVTEVVEGTTTPVERTAVAIGAPVRGEWAAFNGPSNASGHRRLVLALDGHTRDLPAERRKVAAPAITKLVRSAWLLDAFGDLGNKEQISEAYVKFVEAANDIQSSFPQQ